MKRRFRVLIVDDEKPARQRLKSLLKHQENIEIVGLCQGGEEALKHIYEASEENHPIDIIFLDIQMPERDGFEVLNRLYSKPLHPFPVVVFVTAYDQYALRAFDAHAVDYLLKPYSDERFEVALKKATQFIIGETSDQIAKQIGLLLGDIQGNRSEKPRYIERIVMKERGRVWLLPTKEIRWIGAAGVYIEIHTKAGKKYLQRELLGQMAQQLDPSHFIRIHRSHLVSIDSIKELLQDSHGAFTVVLDDDTQLKLSRSYRAHVQEQLGQSL